MHAHFVLTHPEPRSFNAALARAGAALGAGVRAMVLTNQNGAVLELQGRQVGLMANADLSGLAISLK